MSPTASAIVAVTASGHHLLRIDGYSSAKGLPHGRYLKSLPFTVGGHRWSIMWYPMGFGFDCIGYISLYLVLEERVATPVRARFRFGFAAEAPAEALAEESALCFPKRKKKSGKPLFDSGEVLFGTYGSFEGCPRFIKKKALEKSRHLRGDSFTIRCNIVVLNGFRAVAGEVPPAPAKTAAAAAPRVFVSVPPPDLDRHLRGLLDTGNGADVAFEVAGETFAAHRWLLAVRSPAFSAELLAGPSVVRVDKMEPRVFKALLTFMYTDTLPETAKQEEAAAMAQHLLVAAHRYGMERLKLLCEEKLCKIIDAGTAASILALAEPLGCHGLKDACLDFLNRSPANLKAAMASEGFQQLTTSCPSVVKELIAMCSAPKLVQ